MISNTTFTVSYPMSNENTEAQATQRLRSALQRGGRHVLLIGKTTTNSTREILTHIIKRTREEQTMALALTPSEAAGVGLRQLVPSAVDGLMDFTCMMYFRRDPPIYRDFVHNRGSSSQLVIMTLLDYIAIHTQIVWIPVGYVRRDSTTSWEPMFRTLNE